MRSPDHLENVDLVITSYRSLVRIPWVATTSWHLSVLDEAQACKSHVELLTRKPQTGVRRIERQLQSCGYVRDAVAIQNVQNEDGTPIDIERIERRLSQ